MNYFRKMKNKKGFTLIELLIVIAILAILALLGLPRLAAFRADADVREVLSTAQTIGRAGEAYYSSQHPAPTAITATNVTPYLDTPTADRLVTAEFTISLDTTGTQDEVQVTYGTAKTSTGSGNISVGEEVYPVFDPL